MRRVLAAVIDVVAVLVLSFAGFRIALALQSCSSRSCPLVAPLTVVFALLALALYFGAGQVLWRMTPGERIARVPHARSTSDS